jgi:hypothetical protein
MPRRVDRWISVKDLLPKKIDADQYGRVWAVALDAHDRPYPVEAYWVHVRNSAGTVYTHWMPAEWGNPKFRKEV